MNINTGSTDKEVSSLPVWVSSLWGRLSTNFSQPTILWQGGWLHVLVMMILLIAMPLDEVRVNGEARWLKPLKFAISGWLFLWTMAFILKAMPYDRTRRIRYANFITLVMFIELILISFQAARGVGSHHNIQTPLDAAILATMGTSIMLQFFMLSKVTIDTFRLPLHAKSATATAIQGALLALQVASVGGIWMSINFSHNFGQAQDSATMPLTRWNAIGGDMRVMHFFGIHALQILPLLAFGIQKLLPSERAAQRLTLMFVLLYLIFILHLALQGLTGQPFLPHFAKLR